MTIQSIPVQQQQQKPKWVFVLSKRKMTSSLNWHQLRGRNGNANKKRSIYKAVKRSSATATKKTKGTNGNWNNNNNNNNDDDCNTTNLINLQDVSVQLVDKNESFVQRSRRSQTSSNNSIDTGTGSNITTRTTTTRKAEQSRRGLQRIRSDRFDRLTDCMFKMSSSIHESISEDFYYKQEERKMSCYKNLL